MATLADRPWRLREPLRQRGPAFLQVQMTAESPVLHYGPCPRHNAGCAYSSDGKAYIVGGVKGDDFHAVLEGKVRASRVLGF